MLSIGHIWDCFLVAQHVDNKLSFVRNPDYISLMSVLISVLIHDTTSERKARKLVRHSQFCERLSPAVKARAPTSSTTKLWSNHEKTTTVHLSQLPNNPPSLNFAQHFPFSNTWTKIQLQSDPVNMQPDKTKCYSQIPITMLCPAASMMLSTSSGSPPPNSETLSLHMERNCRIRRGAAGYWNVTLTTTRRQACLDVLSPMFDVGKGKMWWLIEICINCVVHRSFDGYHELSDDLKLCRCQMIAGYFWIQCQYDAFKGRTYFRPCKHAWLQM